MKFTLSWLKEHLDTTATLEQITRKLTAIGLEVEQVIDNSAALKPFIVAEIVEAVQHPQADKLRVCRVNDGAGIRQVVCGAPNARAGIKVALAKEGVKIPANGMVIKTSSIRNVESNGMLCSASELGLSSDGQGIIELPDIAIIGDSIAASLGLDDPVIDIAVTPNRADCLGVYGIARDLAAAGVGTLKPVPPASHTAHIASPISVSLQTDACPLFIGCLIKGAKNGPSPEWLRRRLTAIGLRPISTVVDITNYMTMTYGRPLHVFDAAKLSGTISVRQATEGEAFYALNEKQYRLSSDMMVVADSGGAVGIAGVMGGMATSCTENTTDVFLEAAYFDPASVAKTGRALAIDSDARYRFERGIDPAFVKAGAEIATAMIVELCGGSASELVIAGTEPAWRRSIPFHPGKVGSLGGIALSESAISQTLSSLGFALKDGSVTPPSWRADIEGEADLVEEVLRISGYDSIPSATLPTAAKAVLSPERQRNSIIRKSLAARGMTEICSWAFVSAAQAAAFGGTDEGLRLRNPISPELGAMRPSLLPQMLLAAERNAARGFADLALFEIGNVFEDPTPKGQKLMSAGLRSGKAAPRNPFRTERPVDAFDAKADLFKVLETAGLNPAKLAMDRNAPAWYHPTRSGRMTLGGKATLGFFGEIHPLILEMFHVKHRAVGFEAFLDAIPLPRAKSKARAALAVSNFQAVERDFAFVGDEKLAVADIVKAIEAAGKPLIQSARVFDVYAGKGIEPGKKSIAVAVTLQAMDRTLTEPEIEAAAQKIIAGATGLGLTLRA